MALVEAVAFQQLDQRLAATLLGHGRVVNASHQTLADQLGTVREIVTRLLEQFERGLGALGARAHRTGRRRIAASPRCRPQQHGLTGRKPCVTAVTDAACHGAHTGEHGYPAANAPGTRTMKPNAGTIDRALRALLGIVLIALTLTGTVGLWGWLGVVLVATAALGYCPLYTVFGFSTCPMKRN